MLTIGLQQNSSCQVQLSSMKLL